MFTRTLALALVLTSSVLPAQTFETELRELEDLINREMNAQGIPAISIAVRKDDFVWSKGFGFADMENKVPATAESSYRMASVTKPMTAVAILKLVEQGKLNLDAEVQQHVAYFPKKNHPITVRQLLGHLGGISHYRNYPVEGRIRDPKNTKEALAIFQDFDLVAEPGTRYAYSSYGYNLLGAVIEGASGKSFGDFMRSEVWGPLGMSDTRMDSPREIIPNRVRGYVREDGKLRNSEYVDISSRFAAGGTRSTVVDLIKFVRGLEDRKILTRESQELMWTGLVTRDGTATRYGLGWGVTPSAGRFTASHSGGQQETRTMLYYLPRDRFALALASNYEDVDFSPIIDRVALLFLGDTWNANFYFPDRSETSIATAMGIAWNNGLGYYDRFGEPITSDSKQLADAFRYFNDAVSRKRVSAINGEDTVITRGRHQSAGEPFIKVASYMAQELERSGADLEKYHRDGELAFFNDYIALYRRDRSIPRQYRFSRETEELIRRWSGDWKKVWTDEAKRMRPADLVQRDVRERFRAAVRNSSIAPNFAPALVSEAEDAAQSGDPAKAMTIASTALEIYPESEAANGLSGVLAILSGDADRGRQLLDKSARLDPNGYTAARNLLGIVGFLAESNRDAALSLARETARLHPENEDVKKRVAELTAN